MAQEHQVALSTLSYWIARYTVVPSARSSMCTPTENRGMIFTNDKGMEYRFEQEGLNVSLHGENNYTESARYVLDCEGVVGTLKRKITGEIPGYIWSILIIRRWLVRLIGEARKTSNPICSASGALWEEWLARSGRWNEKIKQETNTSSIKIFSLLIPLGCLFRL